MKLLSFSSDVPTKYMLAPLLRNDLRNTLPIPPVAPVIKIFLS